MKIVIKKLFGKFNTELELDKKLNILVGENGVGKSNILRICNLVLNNSYAELTKYYFDCIEIYIDNLKEPIIIYHDFLFPEKEEICEIIEEQEEHSEEGDRLTDLIENLNCNELLNEFLVYCYFGSNLSGKLERCLDKYSYNIKEQINYINKILNKMYQENSNDEKNIKSFVSIDQIINYAQKIQRVLDSIHFGLIAEIIINIIVLAALFKLVDIFENNLKKKFSENKTSQVIKFIPILTKLLKFIIAFILIAALLQNHGYSISSLIAGFGITGLAVGFAANATIANIFGSIAIFSDKAYEVGDYIKIGTMEGTVEDINLRSTKIRTLDNALTIIPNSNIANGDIVNVTRAHKRRIFETVGVTYDTSDEKLHRAIEVIEDVLNRNSEIYSDFVVYLDTLADSSINIKINAYVKTNNYVKYLKIKEQVLLEVIRRFREEGIDFAFPSRTLYMAK